MVSLYDLHGQGDDTRHFVDVHQEHVALYLWIAEPLVQRLIVIALKACGIALVLALLRQCLLTGRVEQTGSAIEHERELHQGIGAC